jgi:anti-sigma factor RsiW
MTCEHNDIKAMLPAYREQGLDQADQFKVERHLASCEDCHAELSLIAMMAEEPVPDPGEAFWATMPDRVHRAVREMKEKKNLLDPAGLWGRLTPARWISAAATAGILLTLSWFIMRAPQQIPDEALSRGYELADETVAATDAVHNMSELDSDELEAVEAWAGQQLASLSPEMERALVNSAGETDFYEELGELNAREVDRLSSKIRDWEREG